MGISARLKFEPIGMEHLARTRQWANDQELNAWMLRSLPVSEQDHEEWYMRLRQNPRRLVLVVKTLPKEEHIGNTGFYNMDFLHRRAEFWVLIGQKQEHNQGFGGEITDYMLEFGFRTLNLHRIFLNVRADNTYAVRMYEKRGLQKEGLLRNHCYIEGKYVDVLVMGILRSEYDKA